MPETLAEIGLDARQMPQILRLAVTLVETGENAKNFRRPLRSENGVGAREGWHVEISRVRPPQPRIMREQPQFQFVGHIDARILPTEEARRAWAESQVPMGYIGEPRDLAVLATFLASPLAHYITGQVIHVDGGTRRFPH